MMGSVVRSRGPMDVGKKEKENGRDEIRRNKKKSNNSIFQTIYGPCGEGNGYIS